MDKEIKKKIGQIALVETHFSQAQPFPWISSSSSQGEPQAV
jgi:hypothetical protein